MVLNEQIESRDKVFDANRLRQTVIQGIPCQFVEFKKVHLPPTKGCHGSEGQDAFITIAPKSESNFWNIRA